LYKKQLFYSLSVKVSLKYSEFCEKIQEKKQFIRAGGVYLALQGEVVDYKKLLSYTLQTQKKADPAQQKQRAISLLKL